MALPGQIRVHKIKAWLRPYPVIYSMVAKAYHNSGFDRIESAASAQPLIDRLRANFYRKYALDRSPSPSGVSPNVAVVLSALRCAYAFDPRTTHGRDPDASKKVTSDRHRFVYCSIPNAASGGIIRGLRESFGSASLIITRGSLAVLLEKRPELADYYKFTVVRNPWSRVVSCYHRKILNANTLGKLEAMSRYPGLRPKMPFERFVEWLCSDNGRDDLDVAQGLRHADQLDVDLMELAPAAFLRAVVTEHRPVTEELARHLLGQALGQEGPAHGRGRLGPKRDLVVAAVGEGMHLLGDHVRGLAERAPEDVGELENWGRHCA